MLEKQPQRRAASAAGAGKRGRCCYGSNAEPVNFRRFVRWSAGARAGGAARDSANSGVLAAAALVHHKRQTAPYGRQARGCGLRGAWQLAMSSPGSRSPCRDTSGATNVDTMMHPPVDRALAALRRGEFVVVADDVTRENEGDLIAAAERITPEAVAF